MGVLFNTPELFALYVKVAHEYKLPFFGYPISRRPRRIFLRPLRKGRHSGLGGHCQSFRSRKRLARFLSPGCEEPETRSHRNHLGYDDTELQAVTLDRPDYGAAGRQRDYDFVTSPEFKKALGENHVILVKRRDFKKLVN